MPTTVLIKDIVDALEMQGEELGYYLDLDTGSVELVHDDLLRQAEESEDDEAPNVPGWQERDWKVCRRIVLTDRFLGLPTKAHIHDWEIMRDFSSSMPSEEIRQDLLDAIHGAGAFRHFQTRIRRHSVLEAWNAFHNEALSRIAIDWCKAHHIAWK